MTTSRPEGERRPYIKTQGQYFDNVAEIFLQPLPEEIQQLLRKIVGAAGVGERSRIIDVGTGTGALIPFFLEAGAQTANIVGVDLSHEMLSRARRRFPEVTFVQSDIVDLSENFSSIELFDVVFFNGCFGNMWDQQDAISAAARWLGGEGQIVISHPLGAQFVESLHRNEPHIVPHCLPDRKQLENFCSNSGLSVAMAETGEDFYLVVLRKTA